MYNLDCQFNFNSDEGMYKLGLWLRRKVLLCDEKLKEAGDVLRDCSFSEDVLRREWEAQIKAQTKPLPHKHFFSYRFKAYVNNFFEGQHKNRGNSAVEEALLLRKSRDAAQEYVDDLRKRILNTSNEPWETASVELELQTAIQALRKAQGRVTTKESALGVEAKNQLRHLIKSVFLTKRMNARALKTQIRERLRSRKFELDRLERSYCKQHSG